METDPLRKIAESLVSSRQGISETVRNKMVDELVAAMERHINAELISRLNDDQAKEFLDLLDSNPSEEATVDFFKQRGIDVNSAVTAALQNFKDAYLGQ